MNERKSPPPLAVTMVTINRINDLHFVTAEPSLSTWQQLKKFVGDALLDSPFWSRALCCFSDAEITSFKRDEEVRKDIRARMRLHMGYTGKYTAVETAIIDEFNETGYDLANISTLQDTNKGVKRSLRGWDNYFAKLGVNPLKLSKMELSPACVVPRFAAAMTLHLRSVLGRLSYSEANALLVEREYLRVARLSFVRKVDIVGHQQFVMNAFFGEHVLDHVALTRSRLPQWLKWTQGINGIPKVQSAC